MEFVEQNWYLFIVAAVSGGMLLWPYLTGNAGQGLTVTQAVQLINREKAVVIDVCDPAEYAAGHVVGSRNLPLASLLSGSQSADGRADGKGGKEQAREKGLPSNKALPVILVCASGARASKAAGHLRKLGYEKVQVLAGGLAAWREANLPVEKSSA